MSLPSMIPFASFWTDLLISVVLYNKTSNGLNVNESHKEIFMNKNRPQVEHTS